MCLFQAWAIQHSIHKPSKVFNASVGLCSGMQSSWRPHVESDGNTSGKSLGPESSQGEKSPTNEEHLLCCDESEKVFLL